MFARWVCASALLVDHLSGMLIVFPGDVDAEHSTLHCCDMILLVRCLALFVGDLIFAE